MSGEFKMEVNDGEQDSDLVISYQGISTVNSHAGKQHFKIQDILTVNYYEVGVLLVPKQHHSYLVNKFNYC